MISKRPTLPTGYVVPGLPPIARALHCDDQVELYALDVADQGGQALLLVRGRGNPTEEPAQLQDWLSKQSSNVLLSYGLVDQQHLSGGRNGATLLVAGSRLADRAFTDASRGALGDLLLDMLDCVASGALAEQFPNFDPKLCWVGPGGRQLVCVCPLAGPMPREPEQVSLVAAAFYRIAAGMEPRTAAGVASPLDKWCRHAGPELSKLIARCLAPAGDPSRFASLEEVRHALGRSGSIDDGGSSASSQGPAKGSEDGRERGLARVAGMHRLKELLQREVVDPVRNPEPFKRYGLTIPNGVLLYGPPGCGKTYIARQLAEELGHYFVEIIPSELASPFIHQSVMRIRELFDEAEIHAPAVIFIDEFEAMVPSRSDLGAHQQYKSEEVNEFLAHLNSCAEKRIFVVAATNQPEKIDSAVRRTGRLDKLIYVGPPDEEARQEMLALHLRGRPIASTLELAPLSRALVGYSASDLKFLVDEAARSAFMNKTDIGEDDFSVAIAKIRPSVPEELESRYRSIEERG
jgi:hypothetical protein